MNAKQRRTDTLINNIKGLIFKGDDGKVAIYTYSKIKGTLFYVDKVTQHVRLYSLPNESINSELIKVYDEIIAAFNF